MYLLSLIICIYHINFAGLAISIFQYTLFSEVFQGLLQNYFPLDARILLFRTEILAGSGRIIARLGQILKHTVAVPLMAAVFGAEYNIHGLHPLLKFELLSVIVPQKMR